METQPSPHAAFRSCYFRQTNMSAALRVVTTSKLFRCIQGFAPSTPWCIVIFEAEHRGMPGFLASSLPETAVRVDDLDALKQFHTLWRTNPYYNSPQSRLDFSNVVYTAMASQRYMILTWLLENHVAEEEVGIHVECAVDLASIECLKIIRAIYPNARARSAMSVDMAIIYHQPDVVRYIVEHDIGPWSLQTLEKICLQGRVDTARLLMSHSSEKPAPHVLDQVAAEGNVNMVELLHKHGAPCSVKALRDAARSGFIKVVRFLCENRSDGNEREAARLAILRGHVDVVVYLVKERHVNCSARNLYEAVDAGQAVVVKYLVENTTVGHLTDARQRAELSNHPILVKMLTQMIEDGVCRVDRARQNRDDEEEATSRPSASKRRRRL